MSFDAVIEKIETRTSYLKRRWWIICIVGIIGGIMGYFWAGSAKAQYKSHLTFSLEEGSSTGGGGIASIAAQFGLGGGGENLGVFAGDNIIEVLKSRRMIEYVLLDIDTFENGHSSTFIDYYLKIKNRGKASASQPLFSGVNNEERSHLTHLQDSILYKVYSNIVRFDIKVARPDMNLNIFELSFSSPNEKFTKVFTERLLEATTKFYVELRTKKSQEAVDILEERVSTSKNSLNSSIANRASSQDANVNAAFATPLVPTQRHQVDMQVYGKAYEELYKNLELARYQLLQQTPLLQVIDEANYPMEKILPNTIKYIAFVAFALMVLFSLLLLAIPLRLQRKL